MSGEKAALRREMVVRRAAAQAAVAQAAAARRLAQVLAAHRHAVLSGYLAMRSEIDPLSAMTAHVGPVCVPVTPPRGQPLSFRAWTPDCALEPGAFGAFVPAAGDWLDPSVLIVPLLAFDRRGHRLGYGGGYYDRTLALLRSRAPRLAIGFAFAAQEVPELPVEPTDQRLDLIVTEAGVITP